MSYFPFGYEPIEPSTWAYLSSLLMLALFFKFNRFWSFRNLDLILLILLAPGLLMVHYGTQRGRELGGEVTSQTQAVLRLTSSNSAVTANQETEQTLDGDSDDAIAHLTGPQRLERLGYIWLFGVGGILLLRLLYDPSVKLKPMLEPNLSLGGMVFLGCSLMVFLFANVLASQPEDLSGPRGAAQLVQRDASNNGQELSRHGPGHFLLHVLPALPTFVDNQNLGVEDPSAPAQEFEFVGVARVMAIFSQLAILGGLILIGYRHFGSFAMGVGMATVFLMLPYTAQFCGSAEHLLPGALLVCSIAAYRRPLLAGILIGLASGVFYYPFFLLPLWISFYWERGRTRFIIGAAVSIVVVVASLVFTSEDVGGFLGQLKQIFGFWWPVFDGLEGIWALNWEKWYRLPMLVGFIVLCFSFAFWPVTKNLATLISCQAAAMVAVQFWHGYGGGLLMAWYLPLTLLVIFRPNLDDQVASSVIDSGRSSRFGRRVLTAA